MTGAGRPPARGNRTLGLTGAPTWLLWEIDAAAGTATSDLDRGTATALASVVVDLRITQVANETWGVHAVLPHGAVLG